MSAWPALHLSLMIMIEEERDALNALIYSLDVPDMHASESVFILKVMSVRLPSIFIILILFLAF